MSDDSTNKTEDSNLTSPNTAKITKQSGLGKKIKIVSIIIWSIVVLLVLIPLLGQLIISKALAAELTSFQSIEINQPLVAFGGKKADVNKVLNVAHKSADKYAKNELDKWEAELIRRIDTDFLNWYFSYFNQKKQEFSVFFQYIGENVLNKFDQRIVNDKIARKINDEIQREFARRVLQKESAEMKFNTIVMNAKVGSKAIATISAKVGSMIDPAVAIALIAWDYWDYTNGVKENKPRLREDLVEYLDNLKKSLLSDPEHSVMSAVNEFEQAIKTSFSQSKFPV